MTNMKNDKIGFGCMRLPVLDSMDQSTFDYEKIIELFDYYIVKGFTYFDTAYTYHKFECEKAIKKALVDRYPRDSYELATKMALREIKCSDDMEKIFCEQLNNCGVEYFDYYLLHNVNTNVYPKCRDFKIFDFIARKKHEGKILKTGMSFHDSPKLLDEILNNYADCLDFVQLQINYVDWNDELIRSRECLEVAKKYNLPVTVMEPCKGGTLIKIPKEAEKLMKDYNPKASIASWAFRFCLSQEGVTRVLSGMNAMFQLKDNLDVIESFIPLKEEENKIINEVTKIIRSKIAIPCTSCGYCIEHCPMSINIPKFFSLFNDTNRMTGSFSSHQVYYHNIVLHGSGKITDCIQCGQCENTCPQHIKIRRYLKEITELFEKKSQFDR